MPSTDTASTLRARARHDRARGASHVARPATRPARWEPPARVEGEPGPQPEPELLRPDARHFGTVSVPAQHHWILDTFMVIAGLVVLLLLFA